MFGSKGWFGLGGLATIAMTVASMLSGSPGTPQTARHDNEVVQAYAKVAAMKQVCSLSPDEEAAVDDALLRMTPDMTDSELNLARSLAGTRGVTLDGETDQATLRDEGFDALWAMSGQPR